VQHLLEPLVVSWGWNPDRPDPKGLGDPWGLKETSGPGGLLDLGEASSRFVDENEWQGTRDPAAYLSVPAAIQFQAEHDWPRVQAECHNLLREARRRIEEYGRTAVRPYEPICPDSPEWYAQMAAFPLPLCDAGALQRRLYEEYRVEVPIIDWNGRQLVRVSVQGYNTPGDVGALVQALRALL
jgi:isopenicillin-N epimerase